MISGYAKSQKGQAKRDVIETAARQMLLRDGYAGVSLRKIAGQLGMSVGNLQYYFSTKDDLVEAVIVNEARKPIEMLGTIAWHPDRPGESIRSAVGSLMRYYAGEAGRFYAIMESLALYDPRYAKIKVEGYDHVLDHIEQLIGIMAPHLTAAGRTRLAPILVALIDGASLQVQFARSGAHDKGIELIISDLSNAIELLLVNWE